MLWGYVMHDNNRTEMAAPSTLIVLGAACGLDIDALILDLGRHWCSGNLFLAGMFVWKQINSNEKLNKT